MDTVIKVEHLSKQYRIGVREGYRTFRETLVDAAKAVQTELKLGVGEGTGTRHDALIAANPALADDETNPQTWQCHPTIRTLGRPPH